MKPIIKTQSQIRNIIDSGKYLTELLMILRWYCRPWVNLLDIEKQASLYIDLHHLAWCFKWYEWYPANTCLSVNDGLVHCIPKDYILQPWDVLKVDTGIDFKWWISDAAISVIVGWDDTNPQWAHLIHTTKKSLDHSMHTLQIGHTMMNYAHSVYSIIKSGKCEVVKNLCGHGVGVKVHEPPHICNWPHKSMKSIVVKENMVFALEPITAIHSTEYIQQGPRDLLTKWWDLWWQREYTVWIGPHGPQIIAGVEEYI